MELIRKSFGLTLITLEGSAITVEQIDECFTFVKNNGIIEYGEKYYTKTSFAELLCALHNNKDLSDNDLNTACEKYEGELLMIDERTLDLMIKRARERNKDNH